MPHLHTLKQKAHAFNVEVYAHYLSYRDGHTEWYKRLLLVLAIVYAISPLDLVPDLTPVFGYLDDVVLATLGVSLWYRLLSKPALQKARLQAYEELSQERVQPAMALRVLSYTWVLLLTLLALVAYKFLTWNILT